MMSRQLLDADQLQAAIVKLADGARRLAGSPHGAALVGIRTRGAVLAQRLHGLLAADPAWKLPLGILDITLYRDDLSMLAPNPIVRKTEIDFDLTDKTILLIDDVLYTGRTIRSAIDAIMDYGRPRAIKLLVLVDRGGRELPIQADHAVLQVAVAEHEVVKVCLAETDARDEVRLAPRQAQAVGGG
ncbi:MAG TPA: bifunctional pyr operon transcriptional regulator/uracil phosphoribosyltransferase PyrR [Candidatus Sumerlaeota bacterium]|nr:bifunctional pyr operon transcriptional regulator/uracil phosphoribosyltransferase PyrR [Candidatus Sumerlaeota bacterium]